MKYLLLRRRLSIKAVVTCYLSCWLVGSVNAADVFISVVPTAWRLQNYVPSLVVAWFTGSTCSSGQIALNASSDAERNRFWATVLAAKLSNKSMFVTYDNSTPGSCPITSYGMDG